MRKNKYAILHSDDNNNHNRCCVYIKITKTVDLFRGHTNFFNEV